MGNNLNLKNKLISIFILALIPAIIFFLIMIYNISISDNQKKDSTEQTLVNATERYVNIAIENIVSIAKTIYINSALYDFLNTEYESTMDYYDAFHDLDKSNSLIIAENTNIKKYTIYTDNKTILNGGNISSLANVKNENWYTEFINSKKTMILYCDDENFSLIRKLDYYKINTGDCYLKIDFNTTSLQDVFYNLDFDGNLYVMSGGTLLYSNVDSATSETVNITSDYSCYTKNYYTVELQYYVCANQNSVQTIDIYFLIYMIPVIILYVISVVASKQIIGSVSSRIKKLNSNYVQNHSFKGLEDSSYEKDEIGELYKNCINLSENYAQKNLEYQKCSKALELSKENYKKIFSQILESDFNVTILKKYHPFIKDKTEDFTPLNNEIEIMKEIFTDKNNIIISQKDDIPEQLFIKSFILPAIIDEIVENDLKNTDTKLFVNINYDNEFLTVSLNHNCDSVKSSRILKLLAIFEDNFYDGLTFKPQYIYNPYIFLKQIYGENLIASADCKNGFNLLLKISVNSMKAGVNL